MSIKLSAISDLPNTDITGYGTLTSNCIIEMSRLYNSGFFKSERISTDTLFKCISSYLCDSTYKRLLSGISGYTVQVLSNDIVTAISATIKDNVIDPYYVRLVDENRTIVPSSGSLYIDCTSQKNTTNNGFLGLRQNKLVNQGSDLSIYVCQNLSDKTWKYCRSSDFGATLISCKSYIFDASNISELNNIKIYDGDDNYREFKGDTIFDNTEKLMAYVPNSTARFYYSKNGEITEAVYEIKDTITAPILLPIISRPGGDFGLVDVNYASKLTFRTGYGILLASHRGLNSGMYIDGEESNGSLDGSGALLSVHAPGGIRLFGVGDNNTTFLKAYDSTVIKENNAINISVKNLITDNTTQAYSPIVQTTNSPELLRQTSDNPDALSQTIDNNEILRQISELSAKMNTLLSYYQQQTAELTSR